MESVTDKRLPIFCSTSYLLRYTTIKSMHRGSIAKPPRHGDMKVLWKLAVRISGARCRCIGTDLATLGDRCQICNESSFTICFCREPEAFEVSQIGGGFEALDRDVRQDRYDLQLKQRPKSRAKLKC